MAKPVPADIWEQRGRAAGHAAMPAAVLADPDDDTPRLVYADWVEEHGDEVDAARAEFIRLQCSIAERQRVGRVAEGDAAWERAAELARRSGEAWATSLPTLPGIRWDYGNAWRGFPRIVASSVAAWHKVRARLSVVVPGDCAEFRATGPADGLLLVGEPFARLRVVSLGINDFRPRGAAQGAPVLFSDRLAQFLACPAARAWRGLSLPIGGRLIVWRLAASDNLASLEWLRLGNYRLSVAGVRPLLDSPRLPKLAWVGGDWFSVSAEAQAQIDAAFAARRR